jgi:hypothetical protein
MFNLNIQSKTQKSSGNVVRPVINCAGYLIHQEVIGLIVNTFGLNMRQLRNHQEQKPTQRIKHKRVIKPTSIEDEQQQQDIPSFVFDAIDLPTKSAKAHQRTRIQMLKPVLKIMGVFRRMPKRELVSVKIRIKLRIGEPMM